MKVEQQAPVIKYTVELTAMELSIIKRELKTLQAHEENAAKANSQDEQMEEMEELCASSFPTITSLILDITSS